MKSIIPIDLECFFYFYRKMKAMACFNRRIRLMPLALLFITIPFSVFAEGNIVLSDGQTVYIPAYSHIYSGNREVPFLLTVTLSIRNVDFDNQIKIHTVNYYETQGHLLEEYIDEPIVLKPLESLRYVIPEMDKSGGSGANFVVEWKSDKPVNPPIIESIMIGTKQQQGISFISRGRPIQSTTRKE